MLFDRRPVLAKRSPSRCAPALIARAAVTPVIVGHRAFASAGPTRAPARRARRGSGRDAHAAADAFAALSRAAAARAKSSARSARRAALASRDRRRALAAADRVPLRGQILALAASLRRAAQLDPRDRRPRARAWPSSIAPSATRAARSLRRALTPGAPSFSRARELHELSPEAGRLAETLDRPLLVTVMGEFNSGKSTFVNALLGEEVAPMGITPTTATINVLKYGAERKGAWSTRMTPPRRRLARRARLLRGSTQRRRAASAWSRCSIRSRPCSASTWSTRPVSTRSTPSTRRPRAASSPRRTRWSGCSPSIRRPRLRARGARKIRAEGKKIARRAQQDRSLHARRAGEIVAHVRESLGTWLETVVPFAAREALKARRSSGRRAARALELRRARADVGGALLLSRARDPARGGAHAARRAARARGKRPARGSSTTRSCAPSRPRWRRCAPTSSCSRATFCASERGRLSQSADEVYTMCAREVLDFARPRRWVFGSNQAAPADRDFLLGLLDERLGALLDASRARDQR
jgi:hypothetical protein